jgi:hypothetical protein
MDEHFFHYLLIAIPVILSIALLSKDKLRLPPLSKFKLFALLILGLFVFTFASPCHTLATDQLLSSNQTIHDCCIAPVAIAQPTVHITPTTEGYIANYQLHLAQDYAQIVATLDNKSPPTLS